MDIRFETLNSERETRTLLWNFYCYAYAPAMVRWILFIFLFSYFCMAEFLPPFSLLFGILSLFENSSFSDRCEVLLFVSLQCRIVFAFRSTIRKSSKPTNSRVFLTPFSKFSPSSFALFPR